MSVVVNGAQIKGTWNLSDTGWTWSDFRGDNAPKVPTLRASYLAVAAFKRCIDLRGRTLSRVPFDVMKLGTDQVVWESERRPVDDLENLGGLKILIRKWASSLCATGAAYGLKDQEAGPGMTVSYANPLSMQIKKTPFGLDYVRTVNGIPKVVPEKLLIPMFQPDWGIEQGPGGADANAGLVNAQILFALHTFLRGYISGGLIKATYLTWDDDGDFPDDDEEVAELEGWWATFFRRASNNPVMRLMSNKVKPETVGEGLKDLADVAIEDMQIKQIATACGVPMSVLEASAANYATALVDRWAWLEDTVLPEAEVIGDALNEHLLEPMGLELVWRPERSPIFQALANAVGSSAIGGAPAQMEIVAGSDEGSAPRLESNGVANSEPVS